MRFLFEIIFCIGAAYGIGWFFSSYYRPLAHQRDDFDRLNDVQHHRGALALMQRVQPQEGTVPGRPIRGRNWLS